MNKPAIFGMLSLAAVLSSGCETTGNPREGGIFWSETKAQERLVAREDTLDRIESDTGRVNRSNRRLESAAARKRRMLGE